MLSVAVKWSLFDHLWYDHLFDHLSLWSFLWSFVDPKHSFYIKRGFVDETSSSLTPWNGQNRKDAARLLGVAPFRICAFPSGKGWYHGMEPRYLTYVVTANLLLYGCWLSGSREKGRLRSGNGVLVSVVTQLGVTRPCVGRDPVWFSGTSFQRRSHVAMGSSLAWPFVGNPIPNTKLVRY